MIAFNIIATNVYMAFAEKLIVSLHKHCKLKFKVNLFSNVPYNGKYKNVTVIEVKHQKWPMMTLKRYHIMNKKSLYKDCSHIFYLDADMLVVANIGSEILGDRVATMHPGFFNIPRSEFPYEDRKESFAYLSKQQGKKYYCGGFNGGSVKEFLLMCETLKNNIDADLQSNIIAKWHDESHFNRYMYYHPPTTVLDSSYCYPESWDMNIPKKILALDKDHEECRKLV